jgi:hypothetical protein
MMTAMKASSVPCTACAATSILPTYAGQSRIMSGHAPHANATSLSTCIQQACSFPFWYQHRFGSTLGWTSSRRSPESVANQSSSPLSTGSVSTAILFHWHTPTRRNLWRKRSSTTSCACTASLSPSFRIGTQCSPPSSGRSSCASPASSST